MFARTIEEAKQAGHLGLKLFVKRDNIAARSIYQHYGFSFEKCETLELDLTQKIEGIK
jgi:hypothetical protein